MILPFSSISQSDIKSDKGNINFHTGTILLYNTVSVGYESFDLIKKSERHAIRSLIRIGLWNTRIAHRNLGVQCSIGFSYILGSGSHHFEHSSEFVSHFDKGLKAQKITYIAGLYRLLIGYRYESQGKPFIFKIGTGWKEVLQMGLAYKL